MTWLESWWEKRRAERPRDPRADAVPAQYGTCTGEPTVHPWSAVVGALTKLPKVVNLDRLRRRVFQLLKVDPDE